MFLLFTVTSVSASFESTLTEDKSQGLFVFLSFLFTVPLLSQRTFKCGSNSPVFQRNTNMFYNSFFLDFEESESESEEEAPPPTIPKV